MGAVGLRYIKSESEPIKRNGQWFIIMGLLNALAQAASYYAFSLTNVSYSIAVSQLGVLLTILWGRLFFKEEETQQRLVGALVMILGVVLIAT